MARSLLIGLLVVAATACVDDGGDGAVRIIRNQSIGEESCVIPATLDATGLSGGHIESSSPIDYVLTPVVRNFASSSSGRLLAQRIAFIEGAKIDLTFVDPELFSASELAANPTLVKFSSPFSAAVNPDGGTAGVGFTVVPVELLRLIQPKLSTARPRAVVNVRIKLYGTMGGGGFESEPFLYPVTVCDYRIGGCVISAQFTCGGTLPAGFTIHKGNACNPYQDGPSDCCTLGSGLVCPGYGAEP